MPESFRRPMRVLVLIPVATLFVASPALADLPGPQFRLEYKVMPGAFDCPAEDDTRTIFLTHFGYDPFSPDAELILSVVARRKAEQLRVDVSTRNDAGTVQWADAYEGNVHCWGLILTAGFMAKMELVPPPSPPVCPSCAPAPPAPAQPSPAAQVPAAAAAPPLNPLKRSAPRRAPAAPEAPRVQVSAGVSGAYGIPPGVSLGPVAAFGVRWRWLSVGVGFDGRFAVSADLDDRFSVPTSVFTGGAYGCLHRGWFFGCGLVEVGHLVVNVTGPYQRADADPNFAAVGMRVGAEFPISARYGIRSYLDGIIPTSTGIEFVQDETLKGKQLLWESPFAFAVLGIAGVVTFD